MLFSDLTNIYPLMLLVGKNFSGRRRDIVEQAGLQKSFPWSLGSLGKHRTVVHCQLLLSHLTDHFIPATTGTEMTLFLKPIISICFKY